MKKKLPPGTRGKLVLRSIPSPQAEARVIALLVRLVKRTSAERIRAIVRNPPVVLFKNLSVEKGQKLISALEKAGALAVFVPHRPAEIKRLKQPTQAPRVVETPVEIVPPPGRLRRKWLRALAAVILLVGSLTALTVSLFPLVRPEGLFSPPILPHADLSGFRPLSAQPPAVLEVPPADMPAALAVQYRPGPDLRFIASFRIIAEHYPLFSGQEAATGFSIGTVETNGNQVRVPVLENGAPFFELNLPLPVGFEKGLAACRALFQRLCGAGGGSACIQGDSAPAMSPASIGSTAALDPVQIVEALYRLESRRAESGPDAGLFRAAALTSARLLEALSPDVMEAGDRIAGYGLAFLAAAGMAGSDRALVREEAELANAMGFSSYAARLVREHPGQFADSYGRMLAASLAADLPAMNELLAAKPPDGGIVLAARTYRRLGLLPRARQAAFLLVKSNPALFFTLSGDILPEDPEKVRQLASVALTRLFTELSVEPGPAEQGGILPPERFTKDLAVGIGRKWPENAVLLIDRDRAASVFESVFARALLIQLEHSTAEEAAKGPSVLVDETAKASSARPIALFMQAVLRHRAGKNRPAAEAASALISRPDAPLFLCERAWRMLDDPVARRNLGPEMIRQINGSPGHRFVLAGVLEDLHRIDDAEQMLRQAAEALPPAPDIYRSLCRLTGSATPLEAAVTENPDSVWLQAAAGQYWAEKKDPAALEKALAYFKEAGRLEPGNPLWGRKSAAVLLRMGNREAAAAILDALADGKERSNPEVRAADRMQLARLYLNMNRAEKALALIKPEPDINQAEAMVIAARAYEIDGQYGRALSAFKEAAKRYPSTPFVLSAAAAFNWRMGRYGQAADLIARGRPVAGPLCTWYIDDFRRVFASAPAPKVKAAVDALQNTGAGPRELEHLAFDLRDAGRFEAALLVLDEIADPTARQRTAAEAARITFRWKGAEEAAEAIARRFDGSGAFSAAEALFELGLYPRALAAVGNPEDYPEPMAERAWLIRTLAWIGSDRKPANLEEETLEHYRGTWLQRKMARVTGVLSQNPDHAAGRYLMGMITVDEMMAWATSGELRSRFAYYAGFSERLKKRYRRTADWYAACLAAGKPDIAEYRWAEEELAAWAQAGIAHRHRLLSKDQSYLWGKRSGE